MNNVKLQTPCKEEVKKLTTIEVFENNSLVK